MIQIQCLGDSKIVEELLYNHKYEKLKEYSYPILWDDDIKFSYWTFDIFLVNIGPTISIFISCYSYLVS